MKPSELRIGNYFSPTRYANGLRIPTDKAGQVITLEFDNVQWVFADQIPAQIEKWNISKYYEIEPITITEEWLQKGRFYQHFGDWAIGVDVDGEIYSLEFRQKGGWFFEGIQLPKQPKFIHELQNLYFAFIGKELKMSLTGETKTN